MKKIGLILVLFCLISYLYNNFFSSQMMTGTYVNRNYENDFINENPHISDTLVLFENNRFASRYWGKGVYKTSCTFRGTKISLKGNDGNGLTSYVNRIMYFGNPKIILYEDLNQYYEKID